MRLWHQDLIPKLPRQQLLGQHRECCALRGNGWNKSHSTVNYVFEYDMEKLIAYHLLVIEEMESRGYNPNQKWKNNFYRGKNCPNNYNVKLFKVDILKSSGKIYFEHDAKYYEECINNLQDKDVDIK